ncbi:DUF4157 domain-containing protein [uncultured Tateyamaria sp.]|uniref:eCIS core domain-containing protein n=1 Tax=uncultured Tateyamaria sp. TaxID=455651 RepID=UPI00261803C1|nr:DUF4157 domain-containing protein [uncultured Tateyamaria sp.]
MERSVAVEAADTAVVQRACDCGGGGACAACAADEQLGVQPKLTLGAPGDVYEQEADRVADRVVSGTGLTGAPIAATPLVQRMEVEPEEDEALQMKAETLQRMDEEEDEAVQMKPESIQRMAEEDEEEAVQMKPDRLQRMEDEEEDSVQMKPAVSGPAAHTGAAAAAVATGGQPLSSADRAYFEPRLGYDFSRVRLHTDASAQRAARSINARAYTLQNHIAFAPGEYGTSTEGRRLMAHELVHTLQQRQAVGCPVVQRAPEASEDQAAVQTTDVTTPCVWDSKAECQCPPPEVAALVKAHGLARATMARSLAALQANRSAAASGGRRTMQMRRIDRVLKRNLGVLRGDEAGLDEALGALKKAQVFIGEIDPANDIRCESGIAGTPCDKAGAAAYYKSGKVTFCTDQERFAPNVNAVTIAAELDKDPDELTEEREEQIEDRVSDISAKKESEAKELKKSGGNSGKGADLETEDYERIAEEAIEARPEVEAAEGALGLSRLAATLIHEAMHHAIDRGLIDVYMDQQYFTEMGRDRRRDPPAKTLALQNPDSYVMLLYDLEERGNDPPVGDEPQMQAGTNVRHTKGIYDLPKPIPVSKDKGVDIRPVLGRRLIGTTYGQSRAVVQELMSSFGVVYTELADPATPLTGLANASLDVLEQDIGLTIDRAAAAKGDVDLSAISTIAFALQQTYIDFFMKTDGKIVIYRRFPGQGEATHRVKISKHADFKALDAEGRVRELLSALPLDQTFLDIFNGSSELINGPVPTLSPNIHTAAIKLSRKLGVLAQ